MRPQGRTSLRLDEKLVNMGLNRWYGWSLGLIPSLWIFADNDDFLGQNLANDPRFQVEAHLTRDFTSTFFGSLDLLYRSGFQSEINGAGMGDELDIGNLGFALNYSVNDHVTLRTSYASNLFGDDDLHNSVLRMQFVYVWNRSTENAKKLMGH